MPSERRYNPSDFETWKAHRRSVRASSETLDFFVRPHSQPPADKWRVATENDAELLSVWEHRIKMPVDNSCSGYDLSLTTRLDLIGWTAQELVDTVRAHREKWAHMIRDEGRLEDPYHENDPGYFERLIRKARATNAQQRISAEAMAMAAEVGEEVSTLGPEGAPQPEHRAKFFHAVNAMLEIDVIDMYTSDRVESPVMLTMVCYGGERRNFPVGSADRLIDDWAMWKNLVVRSGYPREAPLPRKMPAALKELMSRAAGAMLRVTGTASEACGLAAYLWELAQECPTFEEANPARRQAFRRLDSGSAAIELWGEPTECFFVAMQTLLRDIRASRIPRPRAPLGQLLREIGFRPRHVAALNAKDKRTTRSYFAIPLAALQGASAGETGRDDDESERTETRDAVH